MWINVISLLISVASFLAARAAVRVAQSSLRQAERVATRDRQEWKQRTWFDLYLKANEAYDFFEYFQGKYHDRDTESSPERIQEFAQDWNHLMRLMRHVHAMATVFPKNSVIDGLITSTAVFTNEKEALSPDRLAKVFNAVKGLGEKALLAHDILDN